MQKHRISPLPRPFLAAMALALILSGCSYNAAVAPPPPVSIETNLEAPLKGPVGLIIEGDALEASRQVRLSVCNGHDYTVESAPAFRAAATAWLDQVFEQVETGSAGLPHIITLRVEAADYAGRTAVSFSETRFAAQARLEVSLDLKGPGGTIYDTRREATGRAEGTLALTCDNIPDLLSQAMGQAMAQVLSDLTERVANSGKVRAAFRP